MPKTKFQNIVFSIIMVFVMVYVMICYNISISMGELSNQVFILSLKEMLIMYPIAFLVETLFVGKIVKKIAFNTINPKETQPIFIILIISSLTVAFMCPIMSFFASIIINHVEIGNLISNWIQTTIINFPMAFFWQIFYAGPFVRFVFRKMFQKSLQ